MIKIRKFKASDINDAAGIISQVFLEFNYKDGSKDAVRKYINSFDTKNNLENVKNKFSRSPLFFVATDNNKIVGLIRGDKNSISNLFVLGKYQKYGIGRKLILLFEKECRKSNSSKVRLRSSTLSVGFYEKMGFKKSTGIRVFNGLKVQPMKKVLI